MAVRCPFQSPPIKETIKNVSQSPSQTAYSVLANDKISRVRFKMRDSLKGHGIESSRVRGEARRGEIGCGGAPPRRSIVSRVVHLSVVKLQTIGRKGLWSINATTSHAAYRRRPRLAP